MLSDGLQGEAWYAVYTKHQHEKSTQHILASKGFEVLLPLHRVLHRWKDRTQIVFLPVFPCYLFLRTSLSRRLDIMTTSGVFGLVESGGHAVEVTESDINLIRKITLNPTKVEPHPFLKCGERVTVYKGPLSGVDGVLVRIKNQYRVVLSVELLRKSVALEVDVSIIQPLTSTFDKTPMRMSESRVASVESH